MKQKWIVLLALFLCLTSFGMVSAQVQEANLVVWYTFDQIEDNMILDASENRFHGSLHGSITLEDGRYGSAAVFNGVDNYINMGNYQELQPADLTVSYWFKRTSSLAGQEGLIVWAKPSGQWDGAGWYLTIKDQDHETNRPVLLMMDGNTAAYVDDDVDLFYPLNEWVHVAVVVDSNAAAVEVYRNGVPQQVYLTGTPVISATDDPKWFGFNSPLYSGGYLAGVVDDFRIYNTALDHAAVLELAGTTADAVAAVGAADEIDSAEEVVQYKPFGLNQVRLLEGHWKELQEVNAAYLMSLDPDRLLHMFRITAGLPSSARPLGGWEAPQIEIRGHTMGHYLSALAMLYASTGNEEVKARVEAVVVELQKCQEAHGNGYLSAFPENFFDRLESGQSVWVPWYTLHKILAGLYDVYIYTGSETALAVLLNLTNWALQRTDRLSDGQMAAMLNVEFGGMNEVLYNVYAITQDPEHLRLAHRFDQRSLMDPLAAGRDRLAGLHANTQIPKIIGAARRYELTGDPWAYAVSSNFWDIVVNTRSYATGGNSTNEHFGRPNELAFTLGNTNHETCNTYNMLKLTRHLYQWSGDPVYADYYERTLLNGILSTINPETGMKMYFVPMGTGYFKVFHTPNDSFYCCTGTGMESFAKLGDSIYFHRDNALYINLFVASLLDWTEQGVRIEQRTDFPFEEGTKLVIHCDEPTKIALNIRIPYWAVNGVTVKYNGQELAYAPEPASYLTIEQVWQDQDTLEISMPMSLHMHQMPDKPDRVAFMYGPLVLCGLLGRDSMRISTTGVSVTIPVIGPQRRSHIPVSDSEKWDISAWLLPTEEPLTFKLREDLGEIVFKPFYQVYEERYGIYWDLGTPETVLIQEPVEEPILWYRFNQSTRDRIALDSSERGLHGRLIGRAEIAEQGVEAGALKLDGTNGHVLLPEGIMRDLEQVTITAWVYVNQARTWARIFDFGSGTQTNMFLTAHAASSPQLRFAITTSGGAGESLFGRSFGIGVRQWTHIALVLDGTRAVMYVNGDRAASSDQIYLYPWELGNTQNNYIGRSQYGQDPYFDGLIDDFRIYNRALTPDEIRELYLEFKPPAD